MAEKERKFQNDLKKKSKALLPGAVIIEPDPHQRQGLPDLLILYKNQWAALECKRDRVAHHQPNQNYFVRKMYNMSFARFIYPENEEEVLNELQESFRSRGTARVSRRV